MRWDPFPLTAGVLCRPRPSLGGFHSDSMLSLTAVDLQLNLSIMKWAVWCCEKVLAPSWFHSVWYVCDTVHFYLFRQNDCSLELLSRPFQITTIFSPQLSSFKIKKWIKIQTTGVDNHLRISTNFDYTFLKLSFFFPPSRSTVDISLCFRSLSSCMTHKASSSVSSPARGRTIGCCRFQSFLTRDRIYCSSSSSHTVFSFSTERYFSDRCLTGSTEMISPSAHCRSIRLRY